MRSEFTTKTWRLFLYLSASAAVALTLPAVWADVHLYGLTAAGKMVVNGNQLERLPGDYDADEPWMNTHEMWADLLVAA